MRREAGHGGRGRLGPEASLGSEVRSKLPRLLLADKKQNLDRNTSRWEGVTRYPFPGQTLFQLDVRKRLSRFLVISPPLEYDRHLPARY